MELALSLGDASRPASFLDKGPPSRANDDLEFRVGLGLGLAGDGRGRDFCRGEQPDSDVPLQLDLIPLSPSLPRKTPLQFRGLPWLAETRNDSAGESARFSVVNRLPSSAEEAGDCGGAHSPPNSTVSSFPMELGICSGSGRYSKRSDNEVDADRDGSRGSDDDENGMARKKLRLSKEQSTFLEESFKEHSTLNPKQKLALAKQLNLRPRQVEVWFQNRRARTKLKQTEMDCENLKRCCETLTEENRRLQKELQELRALKTSQPFYMQLPPTTLTMCPSCERVATSAAVKPRPCPLPQAHKAETITSDCSNFSSIHDQRIPTITGCSTTALQYHRNRFSATIDTQPAVEFCEIKDEHEEL
ncbi:hypothetical protein SAY86_027640 [Trapa natans]|uniref:Homeobox domain-containing protein n=1 Tax=Trapa natans TaxID=22666 RepID=A0AAN7QMI5_TRANT|nr:hypothetical protein SAY86_027640 [Trapa natans]